MSKANVVEFCYPIDQMSNAEATFGRRIYINEESLAYLAASNFENANKIFSSLAPVAALKAAHHHLEQAIEFELLVPSLAKQIMKEITEHWGHKITDLLSSLVYRPKLPHYDQDILPLLQSGEKVFATCYDVNYYTFSTSMLAAVRMYEDVDDIQLVKKSVREGTDNQDLTIIRGHCLAFINPELGTGRSKAKAYIDQLKYVKGVEKSTLIALKEEIQQKVRDELSNIVSRHSTSMNGHGTLVMNNMINSCSQAINKGLLRVK